MFEKWKTRRAAREAAALARKAAALKISQDDYLRRLENSARTLTGTTHSGYGCDDALDPYEVRSVLRAELARRAEQP